MDIEKYKKAKRLEEELSPIIDIMNMLCLSKEMPEAFNEVRLEFVTSCKTLVVPRCLYGEIFPIIAKYRDKLQKEFDEL